MLDPIVATGDTMTAAISRLKQYGASNIKVASLLVSKQGVDRLHEFHPDVEVIALSLEPELNPKGYILPGLGDVGGRLYGTN